MTVGGYLPCPHLCSTMKHQLFGVKDSEVPKNCFIQIMWLHLQEHSSKDHEAGIWTPCGRAVHQQITLKCILCCFPFFVKWRNPSPKDNALYKREVETWNKQAHNLKGSPTRWLWFFRVPLIKVWKVWTTSSGAWCLRRVLVSSRHQFTLIRYGACFRSARSSISHEFLDHIASCDSGNIIADSRNPHEARKMIRIPLSFWKLLTAGMKSLGHGDSADRV